MWDCCKYVVSHRQIIYIIYFIVTILLKFLIIKDTQNVRCKPFYKNKFLLHCLAYSYIVNVSNNRNSNC